MNSHPVQLLEPVFHFLDRMIHENGDVLYMALVYVSIPLPIFSTGIFPPKEPWSIGRGSFQTWNGISTIRGRADEERSHGPSLHHRRRTNR